MTLLLELLLVTGTAVLAFVGCGIVAGLDDVRRAERRHLVAQAAILLAEIVVVLVVSRLILDLWGWLT